MRKTSVVGVVVCCILLSMAGGANAQLIKQINFSKAEGYVDGLLVGQPANATDKWTAGSVVQGENTFNVQNEAMYVHPDGKASSVIYLYIPFPVQKIKEGNIITATWDWQYFGDPANNMDLGFTISDSGNFNIDGDPMTVFNEYCTPTRMGSLIDARAGNDLAGGGNWVSDNGVEYRDGVLVHCRLVVDIFNYEFDFFAQREGEDEVQVADDFLFRRIPSVETDGVNCIGMWLNGGKPETSVILDNIRIVGPEGYTAVGQWDLYSGCGRTLFWCRLRCIL